MSNLLKHVGLVMKHKRYVFMAMRDCGHPIRGLMHDMSKFSPTEFFESVKYYQGNRSPIEAAKEDKGYSDAWFHHRGRNKHHSQYWVDISFGEVIPCRMPWKYLLEHICDTIGAGRAYMGDKWTKYAPINYWKSRDIKSYYHPHTRAMVVYIYNIIAVYGWKRTSKLLKYDHLEYIYETFSTDEINELNSNFLSIGKN